MELIFLGTGAGLPSKERNVSAIALSLLQELNSIWLFDCGEATQHQILHTTIKPRKINKIFISHLHGDHIFGLPGLLSSRSFQAGNEPCTVYGPEGIKTYIETSLQVSGTHLSYPLHIVEYTEGKLFEDERFRIDCQKLDHGIVSFGFRITEKDKQGELLVDKLMKIGIKPGPIFQKFKEHEQVELDNGEIISSKDFIGEPKQGKVIIILGDTRHTSKNKDFVKHADILVHEATFSHNNHELAKNYYHSTTTEAAMLAKEAQVKQLILTHISARYQKDDLPALLQEAQTIFPATTLAHDFYKRTIT